MSVARIKDIEYKSLGDLLYSSNARMG